MIKTVNERFVSTTIAHADLLEIVKTADPLAREVAANFSNPVTVMFLTPEGKFINKLTVLQELNDIHPDTTFRPGQRWDASPEHNVRVFLQHVDRYFGKTP